MSDFLTTTQLAQKLGLSDSTIRHYRAAGRIMPRAQTPGGHARYDLQEVKAALGLQRERGSSPEPQQITGLTQDSFAPLGVHDVRSSERSGTLPAEMVALGVREAPERWAGRERWGGALLNARRTAHT
jgi:predicted DNA-binding transcriptional regulator AlpA